jgi:hypothetical protein
MRSPRRGPPSSPRIGGNGNYLLPAQGAPGDGEQWASQGRQPAPPPPGPPLRRPTGDPNVRGPPPPNLGGLPIPRSGLATSTPGMPDGLLPGARPDNLGPLPGRNMAGNATSTGLLINSMAPMGLPGGLTAREELHSAARGMAQPALLQQQGLRMQPSDYATGVEAGPIMCNEQGGGMGF